MRRRQLAAIYQVCHKQSGALEECLRGLSRLVPLHCNKELYLPSQRWLCG